MIKPLDAATLTAIYDASMKDTFPRKELKPLKAMLRMQAEGRYDVWGYYDGDELLAYACVCNAAEPVLLDYLAVVEAHRGEGIGSVFLKALMESDAYSAIMLEIEAVHAAFDDADRIKRQRRKNFYERLGFASTTTEAHVFGEHYEVLDDRADLGAHAVNDAMSDIYHYMVPEQDAFEKNIRIFNVR